MTKPLQILHLEDNSARIERVRELMLESGLEHQAVLVSNRQEFAEQLTRNSFSLIICGYPNTGFSAGGVPALVEHHCPETPVLFFVDGMESEQAIELLTAGAADILLRGRHGELKAAVEEALSRAEERKARRISEIALRESEERFRQLCEASYEGILIHERGTILNANSALSGMFGYDISEVIGANIFNFVQPIFWEMVKEKLIYGDSDNYEITGVRKDGALVPLEIQAKTLPFKGVKVRVVVIRDITERKRTAAKIYEQAALLEITQDAIAVADMKGLVTYFNKFAGELFDWDESAMGRKKNDLLSEYESEKLKEAWGKTMAEGKWAGELDVTTLKGKKVLLESRWTLIERNGAATSVLMVSTDISEKKRLEAQFLRTQRMESIGTLAGGIAHDLNNILAPSLMAVHLLRGKLPDEQSRKFLNALETSLQRGAGIVRQVLTFARGADGERGPLQLGHLAKEMAKIADETFPRSISVAQDCPKDLWLVNGDATGMHQVLLNLCVNARDAMPNGGKIVISAENAQLDEHYARMNLDARPGPYVILKVRDAGTGIPKHVLDKIFEPFFTTKEPGKGTGLGLSTALGIVKSHKGFINIYTEVGNGTEFRIYLPASPEAKESAGEIEETIPSGHGELILIADDEGAIRDITRSTLEAHGYEVLTAGDGTEALALYVKEPRKIEVY